MDYQKSKYYIVWAHEEVTGPYRLVRDANKELKRKTVDTWRHVVVKGKYVTDILVLMKKNNESKRGQHGR